MNTNAKLCVIGLPGLYQNWLIGALDPTSQCQDSQENNFISRSDKIDWIKKNDIDLHDVTRYDHVVNCYVKPKNFVWYLYNFLEKTDGVGIMIDSLAHDLFKKAPGTIAFDGLLHHFVESYDIQPTTSINVIENSLIEYFYFVLIEEQSLFRQKAHLNLQSAINIEYDDFFCVDTMSHLFEHLPMFDATHFDKQHRQLLQRNCRYLTMRLLFPWHLTNHRLDLLSWAYIGAIVTKMTDKSLDWYNPGIRQRIVDKYKYKILQWHNA